MKKQDLIKAAEDLNDLLFDEDEKEEGWIFIDSDGATLKSEIKKAAMLLYAGDEITAGTVEVLKSFPWSEEDFKDMGDEIDPVPAFIRYGIIPDPAAEVPETKPKRRGRKPTKKKTEIPEPLHIPDPPPVPEPEPVVEVVPEGELDDMPSIQPEIEDIPDEPVSVEEPTENIPEPEPELEPEPEIPDMSAYSYVIQVMGPDPTMKLHDLTRKMADVGYDMFTVGNSVKTAHSGFRRVYNSLRENGFIDGAR